MNKIYLPRALKFNFGQIEFKVLFLQNKSYTLTAIAILSNLKS